MGVIMKDNKLVLITEPKTIHFDLHEDVGNNLKHEIDFIIEQDEFLAELTIKTRLVDYCPNINIETIFINTESSKTNEPHKSFLNLLKRLGLSSSNTRRKM